MSTKPGQVHYSIISPYDSYARQGRKRDTHWLDYKVHITEACEADQPNLITHVETRPAPQQNVLATQPIHHHLQAKGLLPSTHIVDTAYMSGPLLVGSQETFGVKLHGCAIVLICCSALSTRQAYL